MTKNTLEGINSEQQTVSVQRIKNQQQQFEKQLHHYHILYLFTADLIPNYASFVKNLAYAKVLNNQAIIACALERYKIHNKKLPLTLDKLVPEYLDKVPSQVVIDKPMIYKRVNDQDYILYSIGWNMKDDDGVISDDNRADKLDWVWASKPELYKKQKAPN